METHINHKNPAFIVFLIVVSALLSSCYKQRVVIDHIPLNTPEGSAIYITGDFNNWDPGDEKYRMVNNPDGTYAVELPQGVGKLNYKFTRGDWTRIEKNDCGYDIENRTLTYGGEGIVVNQVACWGDTEPMNCTRTIIAIKKYPENTPDEAVIYLASQFNNWDPGDLKNAFQKSAKGLYFISIDKQADCIDFKITMGNWETVETDGEGRDIDNRQYCFNGNDTLFITVKEWKNITYRKSGKVTFIIKKLPDQTNPGESIYIAGDFNNWNPGNPDYTFHRNSAGMLFYTLITDQESIAYKITRGSWKSVETKTSGDDITDRAFIYGQADTVNLQIDRWKDR